VSEAGVERRLAAILAAGLVGYSRLIREDEATTLATLKAHREELPSQRDKTLRIRGGSAGWLINGYSRARLMITATAL